MMNGTGSGFPYRVAAAWLPQLGRKPYPLLFSSSADDSLYGDYAESLPRLADAGFNYLELAGLIGESGPAQLPLDMTSGFSAERDDLIKKVIGIMHDVGIKYITALGVYSWGFEEVIRAHPELAALRVQDPDLRRPGWDEDLLPYMDRIGPATVPATDVLCASRDESWEWMRRSIDFQLEKYPEIDGYHLESADQGRCWCELCRKISTPEYYTRLYELCGEHLRRVAPEKPLFITNCGSDWGTIRALPYVQRIARYADFVIDYMDSFRLPVKMSLWGRHGMIDQRAQAAAALPTAYGMALHLRDGGMPRDRWFHPLPQSIYSFIHESYEQGCTGLEFYSAGPIYNPGSEFNIEFVGAILQRPQATYAELVEATLDRLYHPRDTDALTGLRNLFEGAEIAGAESWVDFNQVHHTVPDINRGIPQFAREIPIYCLAGYRNSLNRLAVLASELSPRLGDAERAAALPRCLEGSAAAMTDALETRLDGRFDGTPLRAYTRAT